MPEPVHHTTWVAQQGIDFIHEQTSTENPWLFSVNIYDPHAPFDPPKEYLERYRSFLDEVPLPNYVEGELANKPLWQQRRHGSLGEGNAQYPYTKMSDTDHRWLRASYWAMCDLIDVQVGRLLAALDETGQRENTIVIFMADHGEMLGDHGMYLKGPFLYDTLVNIPLMVRYPGVVVAGQQSQAIVELVDIAPTLLEASGLERFPAMQGRSLWPLLTGKVPINQHRPDAYAEMYSSLRPEDHRAHVSMVRAERYKIIVDHKLDTGELYDLVEDPTETRNLWDNPAFLTIKAEMLLRLTHRQAFTCDPMPPHTAPW
jgi:arylsulfatase A-like enzyme